MVPHLGRHGAGIHLQRHAGLLGAGAGVNERRVGVGVRLAVVALQHMCNMTKLPWQSDQTGSSRRLVSNKDQRAKSFAIKQSGAIYNIWRGDKLLVHLHLGDDLQGALQLAGTPRRRDESVVHDRIRLHPRILLTTCLPTFKSKHCQRPAFMRQVQ